MSLRERIIKTLEERRKKVLGGNINCIPLPFSRFREDLPGIEQSTYYLVSGSTKAGKTQITNYLFLFNTIMYCYHHPNKIFPKIFYFPLEETAEAITLRFMSFVLNYLTHGKIKISPTDLKSTNEKKPLPEEILNLMNDVVFVDIMNMYESIVTFYDDRNPTGIYKTLRNYAENEGKTHFKTIRVKNEFGQEEDRKVFDFYTANNPEEYVIIIVDHVSLLDSERGLTLRETINKLSEYLILLRNRYHYIPVVVQQQSVETQNLEAFKSNKIRPTVAGLSDSKYPARDCQVMLGITNPYSFEIPNYLGYDIKKLKGKIRFLEVVINRNGVANGVCPLYFEGSICNFTELPLPNTDELNNFYKSLGVSMLLISYERRRKIVKYKLFKFLCKLFKKNGKHCNYSR